MSERLMQNKTNLDLNVLIDASKNFTDPVLQIHPPQTPRLNEFTNFATPVSNMVIGGEGRYTYASHVNPYEREHWWIPMDHCYARPWNWRPESTFLRPTKTLLMPKQVKRRASNPLSLVQGEDALDVVTVVEEPNLIYDAEKAKHLMEECERHSTLARIDDGSTDWEETVSRVNWNTTQNRLFTGMVGILNNDYLSRLTHTEAHNEAICRRVTIDKSVERMRRLMATVSWDSKYTQWLHQLLIDHLSRPYLTAYLDMLQTLKSKLPTFVDKMMSAANSSRLSMLSYESLFPLLKRPWDPVATSLVQEKPKKLPGNPIIVIVPSTPISSKRLLKWINLFSSIATVVTITSNYGVTTTHKMTVVSCVDQMFVMTRNKIQDLRMDYPSRNIILLGFGFGASLALQVAQVEQVLCTICVGFSLNTAEGKRGDMEDNLLELQCPAMFVVGQSSNTSLQEEMEDLRERMRVETELVVVGSADDNLRISKKKKKAEGITQNVVDRCIMDEVSEFVNRLTLSPYPPQLRQSPTNLTTDAKKTKMERRRYNSNTSSLESEPPSPTPRISRPVGRPPGSKTKTKLDMKWAQARAMSLQNRFPNYLQNEMQTMIQPPPPRQNSGIKVLENVKLTGPMNSKFLSNAGKMIDMSKVSLMNTNPTSSSSIVLFPDGKIKNMNSTGIFEGGRYITSKRQLIGNKPPKPVKKLSHLNQPIQTNLAPPTNLTTQDIMDLPIIFADDNQILEPEIKSPSKINTNKFMVMNKPTNLIVPTKTTPKYTKIILSSKRAEDVSANILSTISPEISVKRIENPTPDVGRIEEFDLEDKIAASTLYKTMEGDKAPFAILENNDDDCMPIEGIDESMLLIEGKSEIVIKRPIEEAEDGPPSKIIKLDV